jgi:hypothetical protein
MKGSLFCIIIKVKNYATLCNELSCCKSVGSEYEQSTYVALYNAFDLESIACPDWPMKGQTGNACEERTAFSANIACLIRHRKMKLQLPLVISAAKSDTVPVPLHLLQETESVTGAFLMQESIPGYSDPWPGKIAADFKEIPPLFFWSHIMPCRYAISQISAGKTAF